MDEDGICDLFSICYNEFSEKRKNILVLHLMPYLKPVTGPGNMEFWRTRKPAGKSSRLQPPFS